MKEKVFISGILVLLYVISIFEKNLIGFIIILEIITISKAFNLFMLLLKTFILNLVNLILSFAMIIIFFGALEW